MPPRAGGDPDFGCFVATSIPGFDDDELLQPRRLYERQGRECRPVVERLEDRPHQYLDTYEGLDERVERAR
jgi:phosphoenolpyruvate carboxykinase (ATP)